MRNQRRRAPILCVLALFVAGIAAVRANPVIEPVPILDGIPGPMIWQNPPAHWSIESQRTLSVTAGAQTDWFVSPMGDSRRDNSPRLLFEPADDFVLSAKVTVDFHSPWDAGVLVLYENNSLWAKLCFESTLDKRTAIVSVATRDVSDDNNSIEMSGPSVYLKIAKAGPAIFFYASPDGQNWTIIRSFSLGKTTDLRAGFSSQSPKGGACTTVFTEIHYKPGKVNLWLGN